MNEQGDKGRISEDEHVFVPVNMDGAAIRAAGAMLHC